MSEPRDQETAAEGTSPRVVRAANAKQADTTRLRVLCLHGYLQNGELFRQKTGSVRKVMKGCEFEFVDAPHPAFNIFPSDGAADSGALAATAGEGTSTGPRGWWPVGELARREPGRVFEEWTLSLAAAREIVQARGPFDGVFAFSQGCAVATALLRDAAAGRLEPMAGARFAVLVGGFVPRDAAIAAELCGGGSPLRVGALHVTGAEDDLVPRSRTGALAELYDGALSEWFEHPGRHGVPSGSGGFKEALQKLLASARSAAP